VGVLQSLHLLLVVHHQQLTLAVLVDNFELLQPAASSLGLVELAFLLTDFAMLV